MGFKKVDLNEIAEITTGFAFKSKEFNTEGKGVRLIRGKNVSTDFVRWGDDTRYWSGDTSNLENLFLQVDDIVIGMDGSKIGHNYARIKQTDLPALLVQRVARLRSNGKINQKLLYYYINNNDFTRYIMNVKTGTSIPHISAKQILNYEINLPTIRAQENIVSLIEPLVEKIELNKKMINNLEQISQTLFKQWFIDFEFPNEEGKPYKSSGGAMVESELGEIPGNWNIKDLKSVLKTVIDYRGKTPKKLGSEWIESGIPAISAKNIKNKTLVNTDKIKYISRETYLKWMQTKLESEDILLTSEAPLGETFYLAEKEEYCLSQRLYALRANRNIINSTYLWELVNSDLFQNYLQGKATGSTVQGIRQKELMKIPVMVPEERILESFERLVKPLLKKNYCLAKENNTLSEIRDTLLPKLLSGEIEIPDNLEV